MEKRKIYFNYILFLKLKVPFHGDLVLILYFLVVEFRIYIYKYLLNVR